MSTLEIEQFICRQDNFGVLIRDAEAGLTAAIDTPDPKPIRQKLAEKGWRLTHIFTTHHHGDHVAGHEALKAETGCEIIGGVKEKLSIPGIDKAYAGGETFLFGRFEVHVIDTPGHTLGHVTYHIPKAGVAFAGDTLFSLGCGRLLEGTPEMMWASLQALMRLPPETLIYCGHEYTLANAAFALTIEPENAALAARAAEAKMHVTQGRPTLPVTLASEMAANPFLRPSSPAIQKKLGMEGRPLAEIFAEIRRRKDVFR